MNILAELLDGGKRIRVPLMVGYLWLAAAWLAFGDSVEGYGLGDAAAVDVLLREMWEGIGGVGQAAAGSFVALLVGGLVVDAIDETILKRITPLGVYEAHPEGDWNIVLSDGPNKGYYDLAEQRRVAIEESDRDRQEVRMRVHMIVSTAPVVAVIAVRGSESMGVALALPAALAATITHAWLIVRRLRRMQNKFTW